MPTLACHCAAPPAWPQTKENLTLRSSSFGSKCELPQTLMDKVGRSGVVEAILQVCSCTPSTHTLASSCSRAAWLTCNADLHGRSATSGLTLQRSEDQDYGLALIIFSAITALQFATFKNQKELKKSDGAKRQRLLGACARSRPA